MICNLLAAYYNVTVDFLLQNKGFFVCFLLVMNIMPSLTPDQHRFFEHYEESQQSDAFVRDVYDILQQDTRMRLTEMLVGILGVDVPSLEDSPVSRIISRLEGSYAVTLPTAHLSTSLVPNREREVFYSALCAFFLREAGLEPFVFSSASLAAYPSTVSPVEKCTQLTTLALYDVLQKPGVAIVSGYSDASLFSEKLLARVPHMLCSGAVVSRMVMPFVDSCVIPLLAEGRSFEDIFAVLREKASKHGEEDVRLVFLLAMLGYKAHRYQDLAYERLQMHGVSDAGVSLFHISSSVFFKAMARLTLPAGGNNWHFLYSSSRGFSNGVNPLFDVVNGELMHTFEAFSVLELDTDKELVDRVREIIGELT
jgi:hypothetical protein